MVVISHGATKDGKAWDLPLRFWGMLLQLIGAAIVWVDLTSSAEDFGVASSHPKTWDWIKGFFRAPPTILVGANFTFSSVIVAGLARGRPALDPQVPVEGRLAILEKYVQAIDGELDGVNKLMGRQKSELKAEIAKETAGLKQAIVGVETQLKNAFVGNYIIMRLGVIWLFVGIVLSSIAIEITEAIQLIPGS